MFGPVALIAHVPGAVRRMAEKLKRRSFNNVVAQPAKTGVQAEHRHFKVCGKPCGRITASPGPPSRT
jgi:hypothetical protein